MKENIFIFIEEEVEVRLINILYLFSSRSDIFREV